MVAVFLSYLVHCALILHMSQSAFGRFSWLMALASIATIAVSLGHSQVLLRAVAALSATRASAGLAYFWRFSHAWVIGVSLFFLLVVGWWPTGFGESDFRAQLFWVGLILPFWALLKLHAAILHGASLTTLAQATETAVRPLVFLSLVLGLIIWRQGELTAADVLMLNALAFAFAFAVTGLFNLKRGTYVSVQWCAGAAGRDWKLLKASAFLALISSFQLLILNVDTLMIGEMLSDEDVAVYRVSILLAMLVGSANEIVEVVIRPRVAAACANGTLVQVLPQARRLAVIASLICFGGWLAFAALGDRILEFAFGKEYVAAYHAALILIFAQVLSTFLGPVGMILNMARQESAHFWIVLLVVLLNVVLNLALIPRFGILGAAVASLVTMVAWRLVALGWLIRSTGVQYFGVMRAAG